MDYKRVNNDINGNPRYVFHYLIFLNEGEKGESINPWEDIREQYELAVKKSRAIGGKKYRGKDFGGGIVIQSFNIEADIKLIKEIADPII